jgi:hypothetical protein
MDSSDEEALLLLAVAEDDDHRFVHYIIIILLLLLGLSLLSSSPLYALQHVIEQNIKICLVISSKLISGKRKGNGFMTYVFSAI